MSGLENPGFRERAKANVGFSALNIVEEPFSCQQRILIAS